MRVLVCGGRDYSNDVMVAFVLDGLMPKPTVIIQGGARGADSLALRYAASRKIEMEQYPADWETYGKAAGWIRNAQMLREGKPDLVVAFPGGKGTANMIKLAREAGVKVIEVK